MNRPPFPPNRFPQRPKPPYIPLTKRGTKAMTIAAAFKCAEGYVLCADSQMSHGGAQESGSFSHFEDKVHWTDGYSYAAGVTGAANDGTLIRPFAQKLFHNLTQQENPQEAMYVTGRSAESAIESTLNDLSTRINAYPELNMLVAVASSDGDVQLFRTDRLLIHVAGPAEVLGMGEQSAIRHLIDSVYEPRFPMKRVAAMAVAVVYLAKKYCPQYCGGPTTVCAVSGSFRPDVTALMPDEILKIESLFRRRMERGLSDFVTEASEII